METGASSTLLSNSSSYQDIQSHVTSLDDIDSLSSTSASSTSVGPSEDDLNDAEREWRESLQQLELILTMVLIPFVGKYFGRKTAYWGWGKYMEWLYPVQVEITNKAAFRGAGIIEAAASL